MNIPDVTIIIPSYNEEKYITRCLGSIIAQDYPKNRLEVLLIDGRSKDRTREIVSEWTRKYCYLKLLDNPRRIQTFATNIGLDRAKGEVIVRMDAHAQYPKDYVSKLVFWLKKTGVDCVGGICVTEPGADTLVGASIALTLSHPFGVGNAHFRTGSNEPKLVDTVPFGCYRKEVFKKIGLFNEKLDRTDDIEFNLRLKRAGGKILLVPGVVSHYYARPTLKAFATQNFGNGFWVVYSNKFAKAPFSWRHLVPFFFILLLAGSLFLSFFYEPFIYVLSSTIGLYFTANILFSSGLALKKGFSYFPFLLLSFATLHFSYGFGSLWGLIRLLRPETKPSYRVGKSKV